MPKHIRVVHAHEFIEATPDGTFDSEKSKETLVQIASFSAPQDGYDIILDLRNTTIRLSGFDLWQLAAELHEFPEVFAHKTAMIVPLEEFDHAGFFALCAQQGGFWVNAFTTAGDAMEWLAAE